MSVIAKLRQELIEQAKIMSVKLPAGAAGDELLDELATHVAQRLGLAEGVAPAALNNTPATVTGYEDLDDELWQILEFIEGFAYDNNAPGTEFEREEMPDELNDAVITVTGKICYAFGYPVTVPGSG